MPLNDDKVPLDVGSCRFVLDQIRGISAIHNLNGASFDALSIIHCFFSSPEHLEEVKTEIHQMLLCIPNPQNRSKAIKLWSSFDESQLTCIRLMATEYMPVVQKPYDKFDDDLVEESRFFMDTVKECLNRHKRLDVVKAIAIWLMVDVDYRDRLFDLVRCALMCIRDEGRCLRCVDFWDYLADKDGEMECLSTMARDAVRNTPC